MKRSKSGYKPSKIAQKMFADLFVCSGAVFELAESEADAKAGRSPVQQMVRDPSMENHLGHVEIRLETWYTIIQERKWCSVMYPFLQIDGDTEIVHSDMLSNGEVKVYIEKPDAKDGFHHATCFLPQYRWENVCGFTDQEMRRFQEVVESTAHLIMEFSRQGGFDHAASF